MINLAPDPAYADILKQMATRMWQRIDETDDFNMDHSHSGTFRYAPVGPATTLPEKLARGYLMCYTLFKSVPCRR